MADGPKNLPNAGTKVPSGQKSAPNPSDRLESWKEIATYLKREVRTVQRWEKREGLPVHRHQHDKGPTVFAYKAELDTWWRDGHSKLRRGDGEEAEARGFAFRASRHWRLWLGAAGVALAASAAAIYAVKFRPSPRLLLGPKDPVLIAEFQNRTGDPVFDGTLRQGLAAQLDQSPFLHIVSDQRIDGELRLMRQATGARLTQGLARQACERMGDAAVLDGSIAKIGTAYSIVLDAVNCSTGTSLARAEAVANDKSHVLAALDNVATSMRRKLGESLASIRKFNKPLRQVTTSSLEALKAYTLGWRANLNLDSTSAVAFLQRAVSLDPNFAMAYAELATAYSPLGEESLAVKNMGKAYALRNRVSEPEKFYISFRYNLYVTHDLLKAEKIGRLWTQTYPAGVMSNAHLAWVESILGQCKEAAAGWRDTMKMLGPTAVGYEYLAAAELCLGRVDGAAAVLRQAKAHGAEMSPLHRLAYLVAFLQGDKATMAREAGWARGKPGVEDQFLFQESGTKAYAGQMAQANDLTARAIASARRSGDKVIVAQYQAQSALREALVGDAGGVRREATAALRISNDKETEVGAALALALAGNPARAGKIAGDLAKRFPEATVVQFSYLPEIRAAIALDRNRPSRAITALRPASPYELGLEDNLFSAYLRGLAYLASHQGAPAAVEFQKIIDHRGFVVPLMVASLAHLGLARARALSGDKAGARKEYQGFLALWQHADPGIPVLMQAKSEYAKLE